MVLKPVRKRGYWRAELVWPNDKPSSPGRRPRRRFSKFKSKEEAEKWIEEHRWLQGQEPAELAISGQQNFQTFCASVCPKLRCKAAGPDEATGGFALVPIRALRASCGLSKLVRPLAGSRLPCGP